jgi:hypothetical protein
LWRIFLKDVERGSDNQHPLHILSLNEFMELRSEKEGIQAVGYESAKREDFENEINSKDKKQTFMKLQVETRV